MPMKNDRMKRAALVLMLSACALLLGGCAAGGQEQIEQRTMLDLSDMPVQTPAEAPMEDGAQDKRMLATLYYLSRDGAELMPVTREITARGGESRAQAALEALLAGPAVAGSGRRNSDAPAGGFLWCGNGKPSGACTDA